MKTKRVMIDSLIPVFFGKTINIHSASTAGCTQAECTQPGVPAMLGGSPTKN